MAVRNSTVKPYTVLALYRLMQRDGNYKISMSIYIRYKSIYVNSNSDRCLISQVHEKHNQKQVFSRCFLTFAAGVCDYHTFSDVDPRHLHATHNSFDISYFLLFIVISYFVISFIVHRYF